MAVVLAIVGALIYETVSRSGLSERFLGDNVDLAGVPLDPRGREVADLEDTVTGRFGGWLRVRRHTSL